MQAYESWRIDGDFAQVLASLPVFDYVDIPADRRRLAALVASVPADDGGVRWHDEVVGRDGGDAPALRLRIYQPIRGGNGAAIMHIHSGGWVVGDLDFEHGGNLQLVRELGVTVVSVGYRLAPEHPYPAGLADCCRAWQWLLAHAGELGVEAARIAVARASAGAALSAGLALRCRDGGWPMPSGICLRDPALDDRLTSASSAFEGTPVVDRTRLIRIWDAYLGAGWRGGEAAPGYAAPLRVPDLRGLPPTYVSASEFDPVRNDGLAFGAALAAAGVAIELHLYPGTYHGSGQYLGARVSQRAEAERLAFLRGVLVL
jgi:acetyl esterase